MLGQLEVGEMEEMTFSAKGMLCRGCSGCLGFLELTTFIYRGGIGPMDKVD